MSDLPPVAALWIGGSLSWLERLCLTSFVEMGHPTTLYTYGPVDFVPEGVSVRDGREIADVDGFITHERSGSFALFSDFFRFHLMAKAPGVIWVDTDIYCWKPLVLGQPHVFGYEAPNRMNGAVLGLPPDSEALRLMLDFTAAPYTIPEFFGPKVRAEYEARAAAGDPVHASEMPWGVWGPLGLTWALRKSGEERFAQPEAVFYPVPFAARSNFFKRPLLAQRMIAEETLTIHIWGRIKRISGKRFDGIAPEGSFLGMLLSKHRIDPAEAPIRSHGKFSFDEEAETEETG